MQLATGPHATTDAPNERGCKIGGFDVRSTSADGRYRVCVDPFEARAFQWVETPELFGTAGRALLGLTDRYWHLDSAEWSGESVVVLQLRHFPLPHDYSCGVVVDCQRMTASVNGAEPGPLGQLGDMLDRAYRDAGSA